ncbi:MAG: hypothetical protein AB7U31_07305, partial [Synergistaceae bacterium]
MRDPEERTRHFIIRKKKEDEIYDEPTVRRVSARQSDDVSHERKRVVEEEKENLREGFFARYSGKGRTKDRDNDR